MYYMGGQGNEGLLLIIERSADLGGHLNGTICGCNLKEKLDSSNGPSFTKGSSIKYELPEAATDKRFVESQRKDSLFKKNLATCNGTHIIRTRTGLIKLNTFH